MGQANDDRGARLVYVQDKLASAINECGSPNALSGLVRKYRLLLVESAGLDVGAVGDVVDLLAKRRGAKTEKSHPGDW